MLHGHHSTANIHSHDIWNYHFAKISLKSNYAAHTGMHIRHYADLTAGNKFLLIVIIVFLSKFNWIGILTVRSGSGHSGYGMRLFPLPAACYASAPPCKMAESCVSRPLLAFTEILPTFSQIFSRYSSSFSL